VYSASVLPESLHTLQKGFTATLLEETIFFWETEADIFDLIGRSNCFVACFGVCVHLYRLKK
jgi:hypothetical protein